MDVWYLTSFDIRYYNRAIITIVFTGKTAVTDETILELKIAHPY